MRWKFTFNDVLFMAAFGVLFYFRNWQATILFVGVVTFLVIRYFNKRKNPPLADDKEFLIDQDDTTDSTAELDVDLNYRKMLNHFRTDYRFDTRTTDSFYEYRIEGTEVFSRLIALKTEEIGEPKHYEVRDGVVLETDIRKLAEGHTDWIKKINEDKIVSRKKEVEWTKMTPMSWYGLKYFIISKKLPKAEARRHLRQELERLKSGCAAFFREAEKLGLERDDDSEFVDRLKIAEGKPRPDNEEIRQLYQKAENFGITDVEFSWEKKLCGVLETLLQD